MPIRWVLIRDPLGQLQTQALLCTETSVDPIQVVQWFVLRWRVEVTPYQVRAGFSKRLELTSEWRLSASGRTGRSHVPHRSCWDCSPG